MEYFAPAAGCSGSMKRLNSLIDTNIGWLRQALEILDRLDARSRSHLRHIIEFYRVFLDGVGSSRVDYDARRRDLRLERSRSAAEGALYSIINALASMPQLRSESAVQVRMEDAPASAGDCWLESSVGRELQALSSHTIHHFALIAMCLRQNGIEVDPDFGMAPSTLRYLATRNAEAA
jgi:hypothetical protein